METAILLESRIENQALEGLRVNLFCHFYMHVFMTRLFQDLFANCARYGAFVCPFLHHFGHHFVIISTNFFRHLFEVGIFLTLRSRRGHLGHISDKGGTGPRWALGVKMC